MTAIICVFYNPSVESVEFWKKMEVDDCITIIIDNTPQKRINNFTDKIIYNRLGQNKGIAYAQNVGIEKSKEYGCDFVIFFDQDSRPERDLIKKLKAEFLQLEERNINVGAIGPKIINKCTGEFYKGCNIEGNNPVLTRSIISSGTFTSNRNIDIIGAADDKLFIDYVDKEWCWRANAKGFSIFTSPNCELKHMVGYRSPSIFSIPFILSAPIRYYYQYRNFIWLLGVSYVPKNWKYKTIIRKSVEFFIIPFLCKEKLKTSKKMIKGIWHGIKGFRDYNKR